MGAIKVLLNGVFVFALTIFMYLFSTPVKAACPPVTLGPCLAGEVGQWGWSVGDSVYRYCDGTDWISMKIKGTATEGACTTTGALDYDAAVGSGNYKFCDGTNWIQLARASSVATCSKQSEIEYDTGTNSLTFCDGTNRFSIIEETAGPPNSFFVLTATATTGDLGGGFSGADAVCLADLQANDWMGKCDALVDAAHVYAFLCDSSTCTVPLGNITYTFAASGDVTAGGATFTTDGSGIGPNDSDDWSDAAHFNNSGTTWSARKVSGGTKWATSPVDGDPANVCNDWSSGNSGESAFWGDNANTGEGRWGSNGNDGCDTTKYLICVVDK